MTRQTNPDIHEIASLWCAWATIGIEAAEVISRRLWVIGSGGPDAHHEAERMVTEKVSAIAEAGSRLAFGQWGLLPHHQSVGLARLVSGKVQANLQRLRR